MKRDELKKLAEGVLEDAFVLSLGVVDDNGVWVADVIYIHDDEMNLYWISSPNTRYSKAIQVNSKVACTITASWETDNERALQIAGTAEKTQPKPELEQKIREKRGLNSNEKEILVNDHVWYVLKTESMKLIYSKEFGYKRLDII